MKLIRKMNGDLMRGPYRFFGKKYVNALIYTSVHEMGHAAVTAYLGIPVRDVYIGNMGGGRCRRTTDATYLDRLRIAVAGYVAEKRFEEDAPYELSCKDMLDNYPGCFSDYEKAVFAAEKLGGSTKMIHEAMRFVDTFLAVPSIDRRYWRLVEKLERTRRLPGAYFKPGFL